MKCFNWERLFRLANKSPGSGKLHHSPTPFLTCPSKVYHMTRCPTCVDIQVQLQSGEAASCRLACLIQEPAQHIMSGLYCKFLRTCVRQKKIWQSSHYEKPGRGHESAQNFFRLTHVRRNLQYDACFGTLGSEAGLLIHQQAIGWMQCIHYAFKSSETRGCKGQESTFFELRLQMNILESSEPLMT